eukprot:745096-Pelagomonas_calceolata.AAC.2
MYPLALYQDAENVRFCPILHDMCTMCTAHESMRHSSRDCQKQLQDEVHVTKGKGKGWSFSCVGMEGTCAL